jgi:hypothetical protein
MRDTLFISHASPEDNPFVLWLSSRLQLMGYKVWCDLEQFSGGERDFWGRIEKPLRDESIKFLIVVSRHSMMSDGVLKEFHFAEQVAKENKLQDFVFPVWIEKVPYSIRIGISIYNKFNFESNWATGFHQLITKLDKDGVPKNTKSSNGFEKIFLQKSEYRVVKRNEKYFTNWWPIDALPDVLYYFKYESENHAVAVSREVRIYPVHRHGNILVSFQTQLPINVAIPKGSDLYSSGSDHVRFDVLPVEKGEISIKDILNDVENGGFPTLSDAQNYLKRLLWKGFMVFARKRGLKTTEMANKVLSFYYPSGVLTKDKTTISYGNRFKTKNVIGKYGESFWHFAVSCKVMLKPTVAFNLRSHIVFSDNAVDVWNDSNKIHSARRKKGKTWFNEHWRDQLMAFINGLKVTQDAEIIIPLNENFTLTMPELTKSFDTDFGYKEPKTNDRQDVLAGIDTDEEDDQEITITND